MAEGIRFAHERGVKVYVTVNIIAHDRDLAGVRSYLGELRELGRLRQGAPLDDLEDRHHREREYVRHDRQHEYDDSERYKYDGTVIASAGCVPGRNNRNRTGRPCARQK